MGNRKPLIERIAEPHRLAKAWHSVSKRSNWNSHGVDGQTVRDFASASRQELRKLKEEINSNSYRPQKNYGVAIPKSNKPGQPPSYRPISISPVRDRVVQRSILDAIWVSIRDRIHTESSFGGVRPYLIKGKKKRESRFRRNVRSVAERIVEFRSQGFEYVFETDIEEFFPSIEKDRLLDILDSVLPDKSLNELLIAAIDTSVANIAELGSRGNLWNETAGVPQGGVLSPVLANLYLSEFDRTIESKGFRMTRYVDDLVIQCNSIDSAMSAYKLVEYELKNIKLHIHPMNIESKSGRLKTQILSPEKSFEFLGIEFNRNTILPVRQAFIKLDEKICEITNAKTNPNLLFNEMLRRVNDTYRGWLTAYDFCNLNMKELRLIDHKVRYCVGSWLSYYGIIKKWKALDEQKQYRLGIPLAEKHKFKPIMGGSRFASSHSYSHT